jgi:ribosomal protein S18 acetylase RimI-like enzyme
MPSDTESQLSLRIRAAVPEDGPRLIPLINSAFSVETFLQGPRTDDARLAAAMEKGTILVGEVAGEDNGGRLLASIYTELRGTHGYAGMLAVDPEHQKSGVGRRMMEAAEAHFRAHGCDKVEITVLSLRPELMPIYRRFGFVETGTEEFNYPHPLAPGLECHCIAMEKLLR